MSEVTLYANVMHIALAQVRVDIDAAAWREADPPNHHDDKVDSDQ